MLAFLRGAGASGLVLLVACGGGGPSLDDFLPEIPSPTGEAQTVFAGRIESESELIPGPASSGLPGDYYMRNSRGRYVIQAPTRVIGVVPPGGNLVDAVPVGEGGGDLAEDQFGELSLVYSLGRTCKHEEVEVVQDGSKGGAAVLVARGVTTRNDYINLRGIGLFNVPGDLDPDVPDSVECATTYILEPDSPMLQVRWTLFNPTDVQLHTPFGSLADTGGEVEVWGRTQGFKRLGIEAITTAGDPAPVDYAVYQAPGVAYGMLPRHDKEGVTNSTFLVAGVSIILYGADKLLDILQPDTYYLDLPGKEGVTYAMDVSVGFDAADAEESFRSGRDEATAPVTGTVEWSDGSPARDARVGLFEDTDGDGELGPGDVILSYMDAGLDGAFEGRVPPGNYLVRAGVQDLGRSDAISIDVGEGGAEVPKMTIPSPVRFDYSIVDDDSGNTMPGKITVFGRHPSLPDSRVFSTYDRLFGVVRMLRSLRGTTVDIGDGADEQLVLPAGADYRVYASRGTEWSVASVDLSPAEGDPAGDLEFRLRRVAQPVGYVSSEYHVHLIGSPDSPVPRADRVATAVADGVEVFAATDHDYVTDLQPWIESLGLERYVRNIAGIESTPFPYGHFNAWPLEPIEDDPSGGAVDWGKGKDGFGMIPGEIFQALRDRGADVVEVNHPRAVPGDISNFQQYFDRAGLVFDYQDRTISGELLEQPVPNDYLRLPPDTSLWDASFDALEIWNGFSVGDSDADGIREIEKLDVCLRDWFNFLSFGREITPIGNSDTHTVVKNPLGMPRTYVRVTDASADALESGRIVDDILDTILGRGDTPRDVVVTNGPHIMLEVNGDSEPIGKTFEAGGQPVDLTIRAIAPLWAQIDTVEIFANATPEVGADVTSLQPLACFTTRDPAGMKATDPCGLAPLGGGAQPLTVTRADLGGGFGRFETEVTLQLDAGDIVNREGASGSDAWLVVRVRGNRGIFPILLSDNAVADDNLDVLVSGDAAAVDQALEGRGVPATALTAPVYIDFDGGGYRAPFAPQ